jgi:hypothetical protein
MKALRLFFSAAWIATIALAASSQTSSPPSTVPAASQGARAIISSSFGPAGSHIAPKPGAPFSAVLVSHIDQTLSDGTTISRDNQEVVMRDNMGRIYRAREIKLPSNAQNADGSNTRLMITILDPVAHVQYLCHPVNVCSQMEYHEPYSHISTFPVPRKTHDVTVEDLGTNSIGGVEAEGRRITRVILAGVVGNDHPMTTVEEVWHSSQLDVDVQVQRSDPRMGTHTVTMNDIALGDPDPKYFQVPEGYRIVEHKPASGGLAPLTPEGDGPQSPPLAPNQ